MGNVSSKDVRSMEITLLIFLLSIEISYAANTEATAQGPVDTVQWAFRDHEVWRVRTFAVDEDVHVFNLDRKDKSLDELIEVARRNTLKHYGDVIAKEVMLNSSEGVEGLLDELERMGLDSHLEEGSSGVLFWTPSGSRYSTKSKPKP